jgi:hypothetical protein
VPEQVRSSDVIDFYWEWQKRQANRQSSAMADFALDNCEETIRRRDWDGFAYWHRIYCRERGTWS